ncbi:hypothetical protein ACJJI5_17815 [Microbulbifer sp. EKSA008]|uniref:hypothetical protein n=1 Tax=Microbulbifer sp. EKSA008 TaxID=3243367 RepID=UPI00404158B1
MRVIALFIVLFLSLAMAKEFEPPKWYPHKDYTPSDKLILAFDVAQEYYVKNLTSTNQPIDYEFHAYATDGGYIVSIMVLYREKDGRHSVAMDGEHCIFLNQQYIIKESRQCIATEPNPLKQ